MNPNEWEQEENYYKQYTQKDTPPRNREEIRAFAMYARMRSQLQNAQVPQYDKNPLLNRMVTKMKEKSKEYFLISGRLAVSRFHLAMAYSGIAAVFLVICIKIFLTIDWNLTHNIHFISDTNQPIKTPALWKYRLWSGKNVVVPEGIRATIFLSDGSILDCQSETQIAIRFNEARRINLTSGKITMYASHNEEKPIIVTTVLGEVQVIGTIFSIALSQQSLSQEEDHHENLDTDLIYPFTDYNDLINHHF